MSAITEHVQRLGLGKEIHLYEIDLSLFGEQNLYLTPGDENSTVHGVTFDGQLYSPYPIIASGFDVTVDGPLPRPTFTVANTNGILTALVLNNDDLVGATLTRRVTFAKFLDDGSDPDPTAILTEDVYIVRRKIGDTPQRGTIGWELGAAIDLVDTYLPNRIAQRDFCDHTYRVWDGAAFDYTNATCPYTGTVYRNAADAPCAAADDVCSKRLTGGCKARFGANAELPFRGFPGIARYRVR